MAIKIQVRESTMVQAAAATPRTSIWISNLDAVVPMNHTLAVYYFRFNGAPDFFNSTVLKAALSRALVQFYPVAGRLKKNGDRIEINCNGEGVLFVDAECDSGMDELGDFSPKPDHSFVPTVDYSQGISTYPLFLVQLTRFKCGGVGFGVAAEHHLFDGISTQHFINSWSEIARGLDISVPPFLDRRAVLSARNPPRPKFNHTEYQLSPSLETPQPIDDLVSHPLIIYKRFKLTRDQLRALKAKCEGNNGTYPTTFEVVSGHVWRCMTEVHGLPDDQLTNMFVAVNGRSKLRPPLPQGYLGNVLFLSKATTTAGELRSNPLAFCVGKIHDAITQIDHDYAMSALDYLELQEDLSSLARGPHLCKSPNVIVTAWHRLPLYDTDFGWGRPVYVGHAAIPAEDKGYVMASPVNDGSIWYAVALSEDHVQHFEKAFYGDVGAAPMQ